MKTENFNENLIKRGSIYDHFYMGDLAWGATWDPFFRKMFGFGTPHRELRTIFEIFKIRKSTEILVYLRIFIEMFVYFRIFWPMCFIKYAYSEAEYAHSVYDYVHSTCISSNFSGLFGLLRIFLYGALVLLN